MERSVDMMSDEVAVPEPMSDRNMRAPVKRSYPAYYQVKADTLFFSDTMNVKKALPVISNTKFIFNSVDNKTQYQHLVYKQGKKFGLYVNGEKQPAQYDSLIYYGPYFITGNLQNGAYIFGMINKEGKEILPQHYDSIAGQPKEMTSDYNSDSSFFIFKNRADRYDYSKKAPYPYAIKYNGYTLAYKNGKTGIYNNNMELIVPAEYNNIYYNGINFMQPSVSEFYILYKDGKYGMGKLNYNRDTKMEVFEIIAQPIFDHKPVYFYDNYYGIPGYKFVALWGDDVKMRGFADVKGKKFYQ